jgi:large subunit ribosomal protein L4
MARTPSLFVGGGVSHGPTGTQNYSLKMSSVQRQSALKSALSAQQARILVCDDTAQLDGKTSSAQKMLVKLLPEATSILVILDKPSQMVLRSLRNLPRVFVTSPARLTTFEIASSDAIVFTKESVKALEARLNKDGEVAAPAVVTEEVPAEKPAKATKTVKKAAAKK